MVVPGANVAVFEAVSIFSAPLISDEAIRLNFEDTTNAEVNDL